MRWNRERRVLERHSRTLGYKLIDVSEPNLFRDVFPYHDVSRIDFDHKIVPTCPAREIFITDTTFRDGQQSRPPYSVEQISDIFDLLHRLGGPNGVIRQSEFFLYSLKDREAVGRCLEKGYRYPEVTGWIRATQSDLKLVKEMGLKETGILTSVSDYHIFHKLNLTRKKAMDNYLRLVQSSLNFGIIPRCHFEDSTRADVYGFCVPFAIELIRLRETTGINIKIRLCDTLGYGIPYPDAALPRGVPKLVRAMIEEAGVPEELLEWHGHNDFHKAFINTTTAWLYGCSGANGTLLGIGERTGNAPIEGLIIEYMGLMGQHNGVDSTAITDIAHYFEKKLGYRISHNHPFVGSDFNATSAGIHADGIIKNEEVYNIFDTKRILKRPMAVIITDKSGRAGIVHWINSHIPASQEKGSIDKKHPGIANIYKWVMKQYDEGRTTSISHEEMEKVVRKYIPELFVSEFDRLKQKAYKLAAHLVEEIIDTEQIRSMKRRLQEPVLEDFLESNPFIQFIYITDIRGKKITKNITHIEDRAKYGAFKLHEDFSDRPWFVGPIKDGMIHITDFYTSLFTGALCITVSGPIRNENDEIVGVLGMDIRFEDLARMEENGEI